MDCAGNLLDCIVMTTRAALFNTRIPKTEIQDLGDGEFEFDVVDDIEDAEPIVGWDRSPISVTLYKVRGFCIKMIYNSNYHYYYYYRWVSDTSLIRPF